MPAFRYSWHAYWVRCYLPRIVRNNCQLFRFKCAGQGRQRLRKADTAVAVLGEQNQGTDIILVVKQQAVIGEYIGLIP